MSVPRVSVIVSVYNSSSYLRDAIDSIINQSFSDFELIVVDDKSTDNSCSIIESYVDRRLILLRNDHNLGIAYSLNRAIQYSKGEYIARMDADDIAFQSRIEKQVNFLDLNQGVGIVGSAYYRINSSGHRLGGLVSKPISDEEIRWSLLLDNPFVHATVMLRRSILVNNALTYDSNFITAQDYDMWVRLLRSCQGANISEPLLSYRVHCDSVGNKYRAIRENNVSLISSKSLQVHLPGFSVSEQSIRSLQKSLFSYARLQSEYGVDRISLARIYLCMFYAYEKTVTKRNIESIKKNVAINAAHLVFYPVTQRFSVSVAKEIFNLYPGVVWRYPIHLIDLCVRNIGRQLILKP